MPFGWYVPNFATPTSSFFSQRKPRNREKTALACCGPARWTSWTWAKSLRRRVFVDLSIKWWWFSIAFCIIIYQRLRLMIKQSDIFGFSFFVNLFVSWQLGCSPDRDECRILSPPGDHGTSRMSPWVGHWRFWTVSCRVYPQSGHAQFVTHDGSMVLLYMVTWIPSIYPLYVSINIPAPWILRVMISLWKRR